MGQEPDKSGQGLRHGSVTTGPPPITPPNADSEAVICLGDWVRDEHGRQGFVVYTDVGRCCVTVAYTADLSGWRSPHGLTILNHHHDDGHPTAPQMVRPS